MMFLCDKDGFCSGFRFYAECSPPCLFAVCTFDPSESRTSHFNCVSAPPLYGISFAAENISIKASLCGPTTAILLSLYEALLLLSNSLTRP